MFIGISRIILVKEKKNSPGVELGFHCSCLNGIFAAWNKHQWVNITFIKSNSQYLNIKKYLQHGPYFSCSSKCECFFFFSKQQCSSAFQEQVRARAGASARTEIGHFPQIRFFFFCIPPSRNRNWAFPRHFSFTRFSL